MRVERFDASGEDPRALAARLRSQTDQSTGAVGAKVAETIAAVRADGDRAVIELGERFDGVRVESLRVADGELAAAEAAVEADLRTALERSAANIRAVAEAQITPARQPAMADGQRISVAEVPVGAAAIYAPGGRSPYPSSVLMGVIPAVVAGVGRVAVASPPGADGLPNAAVLAAARIAGAEDVYAMGGAQAIAALAYGTESVAAVDVIAGPGSPWVQEAKLQCARQVGTDGFKGPSELLVVCDSDANATWVALDLCAQGEHGDDGLLAVASPQRGVLDAIEAAVDRLGTERPSIAAEARLSLIQVADVDAGVALSEALAPEHLELACAGAPELAATISTAGCVFVGPGGGAAFGDYSVGSNHVLPTGGAGRFTGPLGPSAFRRRVSVVELTDDAVKALASTVDVIARSEGFPVHGESALARAERTRGPADQAS